MGIHPVKPRYTCANCLYGDNPRDVPCTICPVPDKPTEMPKKWKPKVDMSEWDPTATNPKEIGNTTTSRTGGVAATEPRFNRKDGQELVCKVKTPGRARRTQLF